MSFLFKFAAAELLRGNIDLEEAGVGDVRVAFCMTLTDADSYTTASYIASLSLDEYGGTGYERKTLSTKTVTFDIPNARAEFDGQNITWTSLGVGARQIEGILLIYQPGATAVAANDIPIAWIDSGFTNFDGNGGDVTIEWNAEGIIQLS